MFAHRARQSLLLSTMLTFVVAASLAGQKTLLNPPGPAPQNVRVLPGSPLLHALAWDRLAGVAGYRVFKTIKGQWYPLTSQVILAETWTDTAVVQPGTLYRVSAIYADGRLGDTDFTYVNPPQPQEPTGFSVQQVGPGAVRLAWNPVPYAAWYRLFGAGQPAEGTVVNGTQTSLTKLADGNYTWQVSADYGGAWGPGPTVSLTIKSSGRYRVVANGFRVANETADGNLDKDGVRDEVFGAFAMFHVTRPQGQLLDQDLRKTQIHGDVRNSAIAFKAGTGGSSGGLVTGDVFPAVLDPSQRYGQAATDQTFPFLIWDGTLTDANDAVIILPTLWEADGIGRTHEKWFLSELTLLPTIWSDLGVQLALKTISISLTTPPAWTYFPATPPPALLSTPMDHPIGSTFDHIVGQVLGGAGKKFHRRAIILTREIIEGTLNNGGSGIVTIPLMDAGAQGIVGNGHYILYVQVERVP